MNKRTSVCCSKNTGHNKCWSWLHEGYLNRSSFTTTYSFTAEIVLEMNTFSVIEVFFKTVRVSLSVIISTLSNNDKQKQRLSENLSKCLSERGKNPFWKGVSLTLKYYHPLIGCPYYWYLILHKSHICNQDMGVCGYIFCVCVYFCACYLMTDIAGRAEMLAICLWCNCSLYLPLLPRLAGQRQTAQRYRDR